MDETETDPGTNMKEDDVIEDNDGDGGDDSKTVEEQKEKANNTDDSNKAEEADADTKNDDKNQKGEQEKTDESNKEEDADAAATEETGVAVAAAAAAATSAPANESAAAAASQSEAGKDAAAAPSQKEKRPSDLGPDYHYDSANVLTFTDPDSRREYVLNAAQTDWLPKDAQKLDANSGGSDANPAEQQQYEFDGETYAYTDAATGIKFKWDLTRKEWMREDKGEGDKEEEEEEEEEMEDEEGMTEEEKKERRYKRRRAQPGWGQQNNYTTDPVSGAQLYKDPNDGMTYEWDKEKNAWFPKIDEDFMAQYQMNYGFTADGKAEPTRPDEPKDDDPSSEGPDAKKAKLASQAASQKAKWFEEDSQRSTKVYVSGLPDTVTDATFHDFMSKCGMVDVDVRRNAPKLKLYRDAGTGRPKGDGLCTYVKVESVTLALQILDGANFGPNVVKVERAKFEMRGDKYDPKLKPKKLKKKELELLKKKHEKFFAWQPDKLRGERAKNERVIVLKNLFDPLEFDKDATLMLEYSRLLREQCSKFGQVRKVVVYDKHPEGVGQVFFASADEADLAKAMMDGRLFGKNRRLMKAATWDGRTKYKVNETKEEEQERLANWDKFLEEEEEEEAKEKRKDGKEEKEETETEKEETDIEKEETDIEKEETDIQKEEQEKEKEEEKEKDEDRDKKDNASAEGSSAIKQA